MVFFPVDPATAAAGARAAAVTHQTATPSQPTRRATEGRNFTVATFLQLKTQEDAESRIVFDAASKSEEELIRALRPGSTGQGTCARGQLATAVAAHEAACGDQVGCLEHACRETSRRRAAGVNSAILWASDPRRAPLLAAVKAGPVAARAAAVAVHDGAAHAPPTVAERNPVDFPWAAAKKLQLRASQPVPSPLPREGRS